MKKPSENQFDLSVFIIQIVSLALMSYSAYKIGYNIGYNSAESNHTSSIYEELSK